MELTALDEKRDAVLKDVKNAFGFVPNLFQEMADRSPMVARLYLQASDLLEKDAHLSQAEQQAVILAVSAYNDCHYCTKAHTVVGSMKGLESAAIEAIKEGNLPENERLANLVKATRRVLGKRGWLNDDDLNELQSHDISRGELYEIVAIVGVKTISNFVNHINLTEVDPQFSK